jgi:hypothetical protein
VWARPSATPTSKFFILSKVIRPETREETAGFFEFVRVAEPSDEKIHQNLRVVEGLERPEKREEIRQNFFEISKLTCIFYLYPQTGNKIDKNYVS